MRNHISTVFTRRSCRFQVFFLGKLCLASAVALLVCIGIVARQEYNLRYWRDFNSARYDRLRVLPSVGVGDDAPLFALKSQDGKQTIDLPDVAKEKPVALVFGSYT
jgi:hypothetical protein